jgi:hypothetical protein
MKLFRGEVTDWKWEWGKIDGMLKVVASCGLRLKLAASWGLRLKLAASCGLQLKLVATCDMKLAANSKRSFTIHQLFHQPHFQKKPPNISS